MMSLQMGDGGSFGYGVMGRGDDKGDSGDGDGDGGVGAIRNAWMCASKYDGDGGVGATSSSSNGSVSSDGETWSIMAGIEAVGARSSSSSSSGSS
ncbi:hypothetical protein Tco_0500335 [Tanacetum coccineum]